MTPEQLEILAHGVTATLATWLGLTVLVRSASGKGARVFSWLCFLLVVWSTAVVVQRLSGDPTVDRVMNAWEEVAAQLLPIAVLHLALAMTVEGRLSRVQGVVLVGGYLLSILVAAVDAFFPAYKITVTGPHLELLGTGNLVGWLWIAFRIGFFAAALAWIGSALRSAGEDLARRRQLQLALGAIALGEIGGTLRILPLDNDRWIGVSVVTLSVIAATYAIFAQGMFLSPRVAGRAFSYSVIVGLGVTLMVGLVVGLDWVTRQMLGIDIPLLIVIALVTTVALFEPISARLRLLLRRLSDRDAAYDRLLRALGQDILTAQHPGSAIEPALARLSRTFRLSGAVVTSTEGEVLSQHGTIDPDTPLALRLPLVAEGQGYGEVVFGPKRSGLPFTSRELDLLTLAGLYLASSIRLAARHDAQAETLTELSAELDALELRGHALSSALVEPDPGERAGQLRVYALGPLRVERGGSLVRQWGGAKAGTRQAEALFAFLFDRGERGASKEEMVELIWPDVDLERADLAFHRTLGGLRTTLEPGRRGGDRGSAIRFYNDRYRLDPDIVAWSDVAAFEERLAEAGRTADPEQGLALLEQARALYRGDYLDDCPFYGDGEHVEERRQLMRGRFIDLLIALGERYEQRGDRTAAAAAFRHARQVAGEELAPADAALARLRLPTG